MKEEINKNLGLGQKRQKYGQEIKKRKSIL